MTMSLRTPWPPAGQKVGQKNLQQRVEVHHKPRARFLQQRHDLCARHFQRRGAVHIVHVACANHVHNVCAFDRRTEHVDHGAEGDDGPPGSPVPAHGIKARGVLHLPQALQQRQHIAPGSGRQRLELRASQKAGKERDAPVVLVTGAAVQDRGQRPCAVFVYSL